MERNSKGVRQDELYRPKVNKKSLDMANAKLKETGQSQNHAEYLIQRGKEYQKKRQEAVANKEAHDLQDSQCTFTP